MQEPESTVAKAMFKKEVMKKLAIDRQHTRAKCLRPSSSQFLLNNLLASDA
jgi:hypothetical protein